MIVKRNTTSTGLVRVLGAACAVALALTAAACSSSGGSGNNGGGGNGDSPMKLRMALPNSATALLAWVAEDQNLYAKHHLQVSTQPVTNITQVPASLGKQYDLTLSTAPNVITARIAHLDIVAAAGNTLNTTNPQSLQVVVKANSPIKSVKDLEGKKVGVPSKGGNVDIAGRYMFMKAGVDVSKIQFITVPPANTADQLAAGRIDAAEAGTPGLTQILKTGARSFGDPFLSLPKVPNLSSVWIANGAWASKNAKAIADFKATLADALSYVKSNLPAAQALLAKKSGVSLDIAKHTALPAFSATLSAADFEVWIDTMKQTGDITGSAPETSTLVAAPGGQ